MAVTPDTEIRLVKCNLNLDNNNQLNFENATAQYNYFNSLTHLTINNASYQRKDNYIRYPAHIDSLIEYNYVMYKNTHYNNKWFYAYITKMEYENDNCTRIYIKTDVYQTWQFDLTFMKSFVEREHVNNDTIGLHTVPEQLETGEYIINSWGDLEDNLALSYFICIGVSIPLDLPNLDKDDRSYGGIYSGLTYYLFDSNTNASKFIKAYDNLGKGEAIYTVFMIPTRLSYINTWYTVSFGNIDDIKLTIVKTGTEPVRLLTNESISINTTINGYTPKNKKLFVYPFNYLYMTNNCGSDVEYHYEDFIDNTPRFNIDGVVTVGCSIKAYPVNYKKYSTYNQSSDFYGTQEFPYGLVCGKYPTCSWDSDSYTNWLTQNAVNIGVSTATSALSTATGFVTGNPMAIAGGLTSVANTIGTIYEHSVIPPTAKGNTNAGDITFSTNNLGFNYFKMSIKSEYARIIDDYFSMYGYKVNSLKVPNITGRSNWNYVKLINPNIEGYIPQEDLQEIKQMFSDGVTIWHTTTHFLDYSQTNSII